MTHFPVRRGSSSRPRPSAPATGRPSARSPRDSSRWESAVRRRSPGSTRPRARRGRRCARGPNSWRNLEVTRRNGGRTPRRGGAKPAPRSGAARAGREPECASRIARSGPAGRSPGTSPPTPPAPSRCTRRHRRPARRPSARSRVRGPHGGVLRGRGGRSVGSNTGAKPKPRRGAGTPVLRPQDWGIPRHKRLDRERNRDPRRRRLHRIGSSGRYSSFTLSAFSGGVPSFHVGIAFFSGG